ncbi:MAG: multicopper oxidase domain-containing protein [Deltaproteobacteria bacterium]|nr:multicopper oxidase domain-containing protein [Deltaproteobacteria bacterium]
MADQIGRRTFLEAVGAVGLSLVLPLGVAGCGRADGVDIAGGGQLPMPPLLEGELQGGVRLFRLRLQTGAVDFGAGAPTATYGVSGAYLGPTLKLRRGERVRIEVTNALDETTTLHWHGMEVPARSDGGPYQTIAAGATWTTEFDVTQRPLTAWYHPHQMHATARHVYMGMAGLIVVEDDPGTPALPASYGIDDLPLVIQDRRFFADGTHPYSNGQHPAMHDMMAGLKGSTILVNGAVVPRGVVPRGLTRLRVLNGSNARNYNLGFGDDRGFLQIASDGGLLAVPVAMTRLLLAPGERAELLVDFSADPTSGVVTLRSYSGEAFAALFTGQMGDNLADALDRGSFDVASFVIGGAPPRALSAPTQLEAIARMAESSAVRTRQLVMSMRMGSVFINAARMTELASVPAAISYDIPAGDTELWVVSNTSGMAHPLHIHHRQFQLLDIDGVAPPPALAGWKDTVLVGPNRVVRLLVSFAGVADREFPYMFHCHILEHEDDGMMGRFFIVQP